MIKDIEGSNLSSMADCELIYLLEMSDITFLDKNRY